MAMRSVVREGWKYIWHMSARDELYDLGADPCEMVNLVDEETDRTEALRSDLFRWLERNLAGRSDPMGPQLERSEEVRGRPHPFL
jgi:arylsulfatase A-like enzyme